MIYNTDIIVKSKNSSLLNKNEKQNLSEEISLFTETLNFILEENKLFLNLDNKIELLEDSSITIKDHFKTISKNFLKKMIENIFEAFKNIISKIFRMFKSAMISIRSESQMIMKYKNQLENYKNDILFQYPFIVFKHLENDSSLNVYKSSINELQYQLENDFNNILKNGTYGTIYNNLLNYKNNLSSPDEYLSKIRSQILGKYNEVSKVEYSELLYKYFRSDQYDKIELSANDIRLSYNNYVNYPKIENYINKNISNIKSESDKIQKKLNNMKIDTYIETDITKDLADNFQDIIYNIIYKIKGICDIYSQYFSAKLDALKDSYIQDRNILLIAIKRYIESGGK